MRRGMIVLVVVVLLGAAWAWRAREVVPESAPGTSVVRADDTPVVADAKADAGPRRGDTPRVRRAPSGNASQPLPADGTPLAEAYDALAARARAGDNAAAMRLAFDLTRCTSRAGADAEALDAMDAGAPPVEDAVLARLDADSRRKLEADAARATAFCRGVASEKVEKRGEWLLLAAERGDAEAMVCFASAPNDFAPPQLSDAWFDWSRRWRDRAPAFAETAYAQGRVDMLAILAEVYSGQTMAGVPLSMYPLAAVIRADPVRAVAYRDIASRIGYGGSERIADAYAALDDRERALARSLADRDAGRFTRPEDGRVSFLPCRRLYAVRRAGSM